MAQFIDLFRHTILLAEFNMLTSFSLHFLANIEGAYTPTWFSSGARAYCLPSKKPEGTFIKAFSWNMEDKFWAAVMHRVLTIRSHQRWGSFTNAYFSNLKTIYRSWNICQSWRDIHFQINPDQSTELWKYLYLNLIVNKRLKMLCHNQPKHKYGKNH